MLYSDFEGQLDGERIKRIKRFLSTFKRWKFMTSSFMMEEKSIKILVENARNFSTSRLQNASQEKMDLIENKQRGKRLALILQLLIALHCK